MKYEREKTAYRNPRTRQNDWNEIFDFKSTRKGLKKQAARSVDKPTITSYNYSAVKLATHQVAYLLHLDTKN
jgi:hypothetical protein